VRQEHGAARVSERRLAEIASRVDTTELRRLEQRVEGRGDLGPSLGLGMIGGSFLELPEHVGPTSGEGDAVVPAGTGLVRLEGVTHDDAAIVARQRLERLRSLVVADARRAPARCRFRIRSCRASGM
jgi:hypothetical protein